MMGAAQTVWIVEPVGYDEHGIRGVFATLEGAMNSQPAHKWIRDKDLKYETYTTEGADCCSNSGYSIYSATVGS